MKFLLIRLVRNKTGQVARSEQLVTADSMLFGRGSDCNLHLPDPRVALHHASIRLGTTGGVIIEAAGDALTIDGNPESTTRLKRGQHIRLGPYAIEVLASPPEIDLAVTLELVDPLVEDAETGRRRERRMRSARAGLAGTWLSKRALAWSGFAVVAAAFLAWPVYHALSTGAQRGHSAAATRASVGITPDASWDPGALDSGHASFGRDCGKCHQTPFVQVQNNACEACHQSVGWHFARDSDAKRQLHRAVFGSNLAHDQGGDGAEGRCAACHRDHKGNQTLKRQDSPLCTDCHRDLKTRHPSVGIANVSDFQTDHPPFTLSMVAPRRTSGNATNTSPLSQIRVSQANRAELVERSNLKFPHQTHLSSKGVRGPDGKQVLGCSTCHVPDETGTRFKPITMREHCQRCHSLEFEPVASARQVPHGNVADVIATVNEFYAQAALLNRPIDQPRATTQRPGSTADAGPAIKNIAWVNQKAQHTVTEMMEKRTCFACHEITRAADSWIIAPIAVTQQWLMKSRFPHVKHNTYTCDKCHAVEDSKSSADIAIPDIKNCRSCHAGNAVEVNKAPGTCETCHSFHVGGSPSTMPALLPKQHPRTPQPGKDRR